MGQTAGGYHCSLMTGLEERAPLSVFRMALIMECTL